MLHFAGRPNWLRAAKHEYTDKLHTEVQSKSCWIVRTEEQVKHRHYQTLYDTVRMTFENPYE